LAISVLFIYKIKAELLRIMIKSCDCDERATRLWSSNGTKHFFLCYENCHLVCP